MSRVLIQVAMAIVFAGSTTGLTPEAFLTSAEPDGDTHEPANMPEPCEQESCSCEDESSDDDATRPRAICHPRLLVASRVSWGDGQVRYGRPPTRLFRPPIG